VTRKKTPKAPAPDVADQDLMKAVTAAIHAVLKGKAKSSDKLAAINAGIKLLAVKYKIEGDNERGFFG